MGDYVKKNIYLLSASDRFNYGDLLFPLITIRELSKRGDYNFINVATTKSDLSRIGALPTESYRVLYNCKTTNNILLIAGGEVLGANWSRLYSYKYRWINFIYNNLKKNKYLEHPLKRLTGSLNNPLPFIPFDPRIRSRFEYVYHAIGGDGISNHRFNNEIQDIFENALFLSLREHATHSDILINLNIPKAKLTPDTAILVSEMFEFEKKSKEDYLVFQIGRYLIEFNFTILKEQLEIVSKETDLVIYLLPLGNCPGHEDNVPLTWLSKNLKCKSKYIVPESLQKIVSIIANAKMFIGTSLHGIITAMSFNVPYMGINSNVKKLKSYIESWAPYPLNRIVPVNKISAEYINVLTVKKNDLQVSSEFQKELTRETFNEINSAIL